jgi:hypothetical protein
MFIISFVDLSCLSFFVLLSQEEEVQDIVRLLSIMVEWLALLLCIWELHF